MFLEKYNQDLLFDPCYFGDSPKNQNQKHKLDKYKKFMMNKKRYKSNTNMMELNKEEPI